MTNYFWLNFYIYITIIGIVLHVIRNDRFHFFRIFFIDPLGQYDISNFLYGLLMICLFTPFTIPASIKYILTKQLYGNTKKIDQKTD